MSPVAITRALRHARFGVASVAMVLFVYVNVPTDFVLRTWRAPVR